MKTIKSLIVAAMMVMTCGLSHAQGGDALSWTLGRSWSNGFNALPDVCTNLDEFQSQYVKNQEQWDAMFQWLAANDLLELPVGKYPIEGTTLVASVEEGENGELEKRRSESHYHHIDFQYVVSGTERYALLDHSTSYPNCAYKPDVIHYDYDISTTVFIDSTPERFFLFFPSDWHIAKIATDLPSQHIKVVVVKLDYVK
ncbi:MAG: YhcH/YjgK/YiaL family protein [Bacteroidales bacterium]|nr:YhcH/YjgK/YiaL family protein [Bacteroidales bacterium]